MSEYTPARTISDLSPASTISDLSPARNAATKTYYWTDKIDNEFPPDFIASKNKRYIIVEQVKALYNNKLIGDVLLHADFIERDHYLDYACCFVNEQPNKDTAKYEYKGYRKNFKLWFSDMKGNKVDVDAFILRLLLIY